MQCIAKDAVKSYRLLNLSSFPFLHFESLLKVGVSNWLLRHSQNPVPEAPREKFLSSLRESPPLRGKKPAFAYMINLKQAQTRGVPEVTIDFFEIPTSGVMIDSVYGLWFPPEKQQEPQQRFEVAVSRPRWSSSPFQKAPLSLQVTTFN